MPETIRVQPWPDPVIDTLGHDPRSLYTETFWLPTLGPTCLLLLRHLAGRFDEEPAPIDLSVASTSLVLGLGPREGNSSPLMRSFSRLVQFELAREHHDGTLAVRRTVPPINRRHVRRLPEHLQVKHTEWVEARLEEPPMAAARAKSRRIAFTMVELGDDLDTVERTLVASGFHPAICRDSATWAWQRHRQAQLEAVAVAATPLRRLPPRPVSVPPPPAA